MKYYIGLKLWVLEHIYLAQSKFMTLITIFSDYFKLKGKQALQNEENMILNEDYLYDKEPILLPLIDLINHQPI